MRFTALIFFICSQVPSSLAVVNEDHLVGQAVLVPSHGLFHWLSREEILFIVRGNDKEMFTNY